MIEVAICEDDNNYVKTIKEYLRRYEKEKGCRFQIKVYEDGIDLVKDYRPQYDIVFMDIEMKYLDGMETAKKVREQDAHVKFIFVTNLAQYAIQGYEVGAKGFLVKPVNYIAFEKQIDKSVQEIRRSKAAYLSVRYAGGIKRYELNDIYYIESEGHYVYICGKDGVEKFLCSMKSMMQKLDGSGFFRCNSSTIVSLEHVDKVLSNMILVKGHEIPISRIKKKAFMEALTNYIGGADDI